MTGRKTPLLQQIGEALYGPRWQTDLARELTISDRTMRRWAAEPDAVPDGAWEDMHRLLQSRAVEISDLTRDLVAMLKDR